MHCSTFDQCAYCRIDFLPTVTSIIDDYDYKLEMFNQHVFNDLEDVRHVVEKENDLNMLAARDELFNRLSQILVKHGMNDIVGAAILHNHFYLNDDEILTLNISIYDDVEFIAYPIQANETEFVPYMFKYEFSEDKFHIYPLQYIVDDNGAMRSKFDTMLSDPAMLLEIGDVLVELDMIDYVGIFVNYYASSELRNESTDKKRRLQYFTVGDNRDDLTLITQYSFKDASCAEAYTGCSIQTACIAYCYWDTDPNHDHSALHDSDDDRISAHN